MRQTDSVQARTRANNAFYINFKSALGTVDYRSAAELVALVIAAIAAAVAASMGAEWWAYLIIIGVLLVAIFVGARFW